MPVIITSNFQQLTDERYRGRGRPRNEDYDIAIPEDWEEHLFSDNCSELLWDDVEWKK